MASIKQYAAKSGPKGKLWRVQYRDAQGKSRTKSGFRVKAEAELWASKNTVDLATDDWIAPEDRTTRVEELWGRWWRSKQPTLAPSSQKALKASWTTHVKPQWGTTQLSKVTSADIQDWVDDLATRRSASIVHRAVEILRGLMSDAVRFRKIKRNPVTDLRLPPRSRKKPTTITQIRSRCLKEAADYFPMMGIEWKESMAHGKWDQDQLKIRTVKPDDEQT